MNEPPDPGGSAPLPSNFVTIECDESSMDTDHSVNSISKNRKRNRAHKICRHCNKKMRKNIGSQKDIGCSCRDENIIMDSENISSPSIVHKETQQTNISSQPNETSRRLYNHLDASPYIIHIQRIQTAQNDGTTLHPMTVGRMLKQNKINNISNGSLKRIGRNRIALSFNSYTSANEFLNSKILNENHLKAFIPSFTITRVGIVRGIPTEWTPEEIMENITTPIGCGNIIKVRRINYKVMVEGVPVWKPTQSVVIHFDGQVLPKRIFICFNSLPVDLYIFPTIQCYNCCRYGHTKMQCRSKPRCYRCGQEHSGETCKIDDDCVQCCLCSGSHVATNRVCPEFKRQKDIKVYMAQNCVSYPEASKLHPSVSKSYADVLLTSQPKYIQNSNLPLSSSNSTSYKKTVFLKPRTPTKTNKGYNKIEHNNILSDFTIPSPSNGCALLQRKENKNTTELQNPLISETIELLQTLARSSPYLPSNAAPLVEILSKSISVNNGYTQHNTVELP